MGLILFFAAALAVGSPDVQVGTVAGKVESGKLERLSPEGVTLSTAAGKLELPHDEVLFVRPKSSIAIETAAPPKPSVWIDLVDGSRLTGANLTIKKGVATLVLKDGATIDLPSKSIHKVRFAAPDDRQSAAWPENVADSAAGDLLAVRKNGNVDFLSGVVGDLNAETIEFQFSGETIPVKRAKVDGFILFQKEADKLPAAAGTVDDARGWHLQARSIALVDDKLEVTLLSGAVIQEPWELVRRLDYSSGKLTYLSDLEPQSVQWTPFIKFGTAVEGLSHYYGLRRDEGREHQPLRIAGKTFTKGVSIYSRTLATYRLPAGMKKFQAVAGIDDAVREGGVVRLEISADGKSLFNQTINGSNSPVALDLDISGARKLSILVDYGDDFDAGDYLDLGDARMLK
jgi:hypothetical protein